MPIRQLGFELMASDLPPSCGTIVLVCEVSLCHRPPDCSKVDPLIIMTIVRKDLYWELSFRRPWLGVMNSGE
jgi:hypothetical protein